MVTDSSRNDRVSLPFPSHFAKIYIAWDQFSLSSYYTRTPVYTHLVESFLFGKRSSWEFFETTVLLDCRFSLIQRREMLTFESLLFNFY